MKDFFLKVSNYIPFTSSGFILLIISIYLLGYGWGSGNLYAFLFSILSFLFLFIFIIIGFLLKLKNDNEAYFIDTSKSIYSRIDNQTINVIFNFQLPFFFRIHYVLKGNFIVGRNAEFSCYFHLSLNPNKNKLLEIPVYFPFCGNANLIGFGSIRDIFGFIKIPLKKVENINLLVLPPYFPEKPKIHLLPSSSQENLRNIRSNDEEKYFMREYIPGDRLKDINWKSSIKIQELITKISPTSPEESHLIYVELRPYHYDNLDGPEAILQLNYLKSWVLSFLRVMKREHPNYKFHIFTGTEAIIIESEEEIDSFAKKLANLNYLKEKVFKETPPAMEKFVFSTGFDKNLNNFLNQSKCKIYLFRVVYGTDRQVFLNNNFSLSLIPKLWIFKREFSDTSTPKPKNGKVIEEKLKLNYL